MKIKVSEATNNQIDWLVAQCEQTHRRYNYGAPVFDGKVYETEGLRLIGANFNPSTNWKFSGPIIDRMFSEGLRIHNAEYVTGVHNSNLIAASLKGSEWFHFGSTLSIATMRCYIASKLGEIVEVPDELI